MQMLESSIVMNMREQKLIKKRMRIIIFAKYAFIHDNYTDRNVEPVIY